MDQEKEKMERYIEALKAEMSECRKNEERWSQRVTKLMEKIIGLEQQVNDLQEATDGQKADEQNTLKKTAAEGVRRLRHLTEALSEPLAPLLTLSGGILEDEALSAEQRVQLEEIHQFAKRLQSIVFYRQELIRLEDKTVCIEPEWFDLSSFLTEVTDEFTRRAETKGVFFAFSRKGSLSGKCMADHARISLVLNAIFDRALKKTSKGQMGLQVICEPADGDHSELSFLLMYNGLDEDSVLIDVLSKLDDSEESDELLDAEQMELNLLCRQARLLGGTLLIDNPTGRKSLLHFTLPIELDPDSQVAMDERVASFEKRA